MGTWAISCEEWKGRVQKDTTRKGTTHLAQEKNMVQGNLPEIYKVDTSEDS